MIRNTAWIVTALIIAALVAVVATIVFPEHLRAAECQELDVEHVKSLSNLWNEVLLFTFYTWGSWGSDKLHSLQVVGASTQTLLWPVNSIFVFSLHSLGLGKEHKPLWTSSFQMQTLLSGKITQVSSTWVSFLYEIPFIMTEGSGHAQKNGRRRRGWKWEWHGPYSGLTVYPGIGFLGRIRLCQWKMLFIVSRPSLPEDLATTALPVRSLQCHSMHTLTYKHTPTSPLRLVHRENKASRLQKASLFCQ